MTCMKMNNDSQPVAVVFLIKHFSFFITLHCRILQTWNSQIKRTSVKVDTYGLCQMSEFFSVLNQLILCLFDTKWYGAMWHVSMADSASKSIHSQTILLAGYCHCPAKSVVCSLISLVFIQNGIVLKGSYSIFYDKVYKN